MKALLLLAFILAVNAISHEEAVQKFVEFQHKYQKSYATDDEFQQRFQIFKKNLANAEQLQKREKGTATYGVTKFSDLSEQEFRSKYLMPKFSAKDAKPGKLAVFNSSWVAPPKQSSFDWNSKGAVTAVYNQGQCGSCWAFSATETIESYWFLAGNSLTQLAMQQIVDCDTTDQGCNGGWTYDAYQYVMSAGGIEPLSDYAYTAETGTCAFNAGEVAAKISNWAYVTQSKDEGAMLTWVQNSGPASICVDASSWSSYTGGVMSSCTDSLDHCVQLTGFGSYSGEDAWNVRNSWGTDWGEAGYIYLLRGQDTCGCAEVVTSVSI
jgi:cathepsin F